MASYSLDNELILSAVVIPFMRSYLLHEFMLSGVFMFMFGELLNSE